MVSKGTCIVVTLEFISKVLCDPRVDNPNYPSHSHLSSISRDELASLFYEKDMLWGGTLNFAITEFDKGPQILNMVMTFVLTPWSHNNTITKPRARFPLSLIEGFSIVSTPGLDWSGSGKTAAAVMGLRSTTCCGDSSHECRAPLEGPSQYNGACCSCGASSALSLDGGR